MFSNKEADIKGLTVNSMFVFFPVFCSLFLLMPPQWSFHKQGPLNAYMVPPLTQVYKQQGLFTLP